MPVVHVPGCEVIWQRQRGVPVVHVSGCGVIWQRQRGMPVVHVPGCGVIWQRQRGVPVVHVSGCGVLWPRQRGVPGVHAPGRVPERGVPVTPGVYQVVRCSEPTAENIRCQKCLEIGHWTYECSGKRKYVTRTSRTKMMRKRQRLEEEQQKLSLL